MIACRRAAFAITVMSIIVSTTAAAQDKSKKKQKPKRTDDVVYISSVRGDMLVLESDAGHYVAIRPEWKDGESSSGYGRSPNSEHHIYFGDDKNLYRLRTWGFSFENKQSYESILWDPRVRAGLEYKSGKWLLKCGEREIDLTDITGRTSAKQLVNKAVFHMPMWKREAYALARDDDAHYYYVDRLLDSEAGFRVFAGPKGKLRELKMLDIARDSEGDIFATKEGSLRLIINKDRNVQLTWVENKKPTPLTYVPVLNNLELIYGELGVYTSEPLGTPCDHY